MHLLYKEFMPKSKTILIEKSVLSSMGQRHFSPCGNCYMLYIQWNFSKLKPSPQPLYYRTFCQFAARLSPN